MVDLSVRELDLLRRLESKPALRPVFFRKVSGLKWFGALSEAGYFNPENIPAPVPAKEDGYVTIPRWHVVDYLVRTSDQLQDETNTEHVPKFLKIIADTTGYAKENGISNYHVWWQFAEILSRVPAEYLEPIYLDCVDYWLSDKYDRSLVAEVVGEKWLPSLLIQGTEASQNIALKILEIIFRVRFEVASTDLGGRKKAHFLIDDYRAKRIIEKTASLSGRHLGRRAAELFQAKLSAVLEELHVDARSAIWRPAIADHEQNKYRSSSENALLVAFRNAVCGFVDAYPDEAYAYIEGLLSIPYQTMQRVAIHAVTHNWQRFATLADIIINEKYMAANYRHETWHFLNKNYPAFDQAQRERVLSLIQHITRVSEGGSVLEGASAYEQSVWLSAVKDFGEEERKRYLDAISVTKAEPDNPDFSSYMMTGWFGEKSPYSVDELSALSINELVELLNRYEPTGGVLEPGLEGLARTVKELVKIRPLEYGTRLCELAELDLAYICSIIEAYGELWADKAKLPWPELWDHLLIFISRLLNEDQFWAPERSEVRRAFVANRHWVVGAIARFLEAGAKTDDHAFPEECHDKVEAILELLLEKEPGEKFEADSDAVFVAINSPRGQCLRALINLSLRACRLRDRSNSRNHTDAWEHYSHYFSEELRRSERGEYEFATLVTNYLPNFLYMSRLWVLTNLARIFDQNDYRKWLCAMQGYGYVNIVDPDIYSFLKQQGDMKRALDDEHLKTQVGEKVIQHIAVANLNDFDTLDNQGSLVNEVLSRGVLEELTHLIWFYWTLRTDCDERLRAKVLELWPHMVRIVNSSEREGRKLASSLCKWAVFIDRLDDERKAIMTLIAPYADESHNAYDLLENLARLSRNQPFEANEVWQSMLRGSASDYPEEAVRELLTNLVRCGPEGVRAARDTASTYLQKGMLRPSEWLQDVIKAKLD